MKFAIVASKKDPAALNIIQNLKKLDCKLPIYFTEKEIIFAENINETINADFLIFASKHQSQKEIKTLSVHAIGNWNKAEFGGKAQTLCSTSSLILKNFFQTLNKTNNLDYEVSLEVTHHGPFVKTPCLFIEIGSTKKQWQDKKAGEIIAKTIIKSTKNQKKGKYKVAIGVGGPHYCSNFNQIQLENKFAISHIIPEYAFPLKKQMIEQAISKTAEKIDCFLIDWKGLGNSKQRKNVLEILKEFDLETLKTREAKVN